MTGQLMISPPTVYAGNNFTADHAMICKQRDYYSALQQAERPRGQTLDFCMQRCRDRAYPPRHFRRTAEYGIQ